MQVLHYFLEDPQVGFVAITNHALDAAKSNRCAILLRAEPDHKELMEICRGCLGDQDEQRRLLSQRVVGLDLWLTDALDRMCSAYQDLMREAVPGLGWFNTFFGLRDFMQFIKLLARLSRGAAVRSYARTQPHILASVLLVPHVLSVLRPDLNGR